MERARSTVIPRPAPATRPIFWVFLVLSVILKTSLSSAATLPVDEATQVSAPSASAFAD